MDNKWQSKERPDVDNFPLLSQTLSNFKDIDINNEDYIKLSNQLIIFKQLKQDQIYTAAKIPFEEMKTKLYHDLEESLTEAVLINNPKVRNEHLRKLNLWFNHTLQYFESLICIKEKTKKDFNQLIDDEPLELDEEISQEEHRKHRCDIEGFEAPNLRLKEYQRKEVSVPIGIRQMNVTDTSSFRKTEDKFKRTSSGKSTHLKSTFCATQTGTKFFKPNTYVASIINGTDYQGIKKASKEVFNPSKEMKSSYSYLRPEYKYQHLVLEKEINENKMKCVAAKRNADEVSDAIQQFSQRRAAFKQKVNRKQEMKEMVKKYRVIVALNAKKEEEEKARQAKEKQLKEMTERENERKRAKEQEELEKKKEEEELSKKDKSHYPKSSSLSNDLNHNQGEKDYFPNDDYYNEEEEEGDEVEEEEEEELQEQTEEKVIEVKPKEKIAINTVKYISPSVTSSNERVINIDCKISRESIRIKNNKEMLQRKINERDNALLEMNQQIQISLPSDLIAYTNTSHKVMSLRTFNSKMLNIKQIDIAKDTYQKSLRPLSLYDQTHITKTEPACKALSNSNTFSFVYNSFQRNPNDFLNLRQTLSSFRENTSINKVSRNFGNIKIALKNAGSNPCEMQADTPLNFLPFTSSNLLHLP